MSRRPRKISEFSHVIVRGVGKQALFEEDKDRYYYLNLLKKYSEENNIVIMAYCLMENHVHLMIRDLSGVLSEFMKKTGISYAFYYNTKYNRVGHLFQDRFLSEPLNGSDVLLAVFRYILNNPQKAGISPANKYKWSSYREYGKKNVLTDSSVLEDLIGDRNNFVKFMQADDSAECMEYEKTRRDDIWALKIIRETLSLRSGTELMKMSKEKRNDALILLKSKGISNRQLERLTGISRGITDRL